MYPLRVILIGELFVQIFDIFFAQFFNLPYFPVLTYEGGMLFWGSVFFCLF